MAPVHPSFYRPDLQPIDEPLYVCTMLSDPLRWRSRYRNYWQFERHVACSGGKLFTAEVALGERPFEVTKPGRADHLQLRTGDELWHKENALNLLMARLPSDWRYVAWIDADITFSRPDWVQETIQRLQHWPVLQMFSQCQDMDEDYAAGALASGFAYCYQEGLPPMRVAGPLGDYYSGGGGSKTGTYWHPGYAWASTRDTLNALGGLMDFCVYASADWHMAMALVGRVEETLAANYTDTYREWVRAWGRRADQHIRGNLGYLPGLILHQWHGAKSDRGYQDRYGMMGAYNPAWDIFRDTQGLWQLDPTNVELRENLRRCARRRNEDG